MTTTPAATRVTDRILAVGALLGLVALLSAARGAALGVRPLVFRSGSMAPMIDTGSLALARSVPAADLRPGDVVSVRTASGERVTHRVVRVDPAAGPDRVTLTLRGDANPSPDAEQYVVGSAARVFWHVPWLGYVVGTALSPTALGATGLVLALLLLSGGSADRRPRRRPRRRPGRHAAPARGQGRMQKPIVVAAATAAALAGSAGPAGAAAWTDDVSITGSAYTATTVAPTVVSCGTLVVGTTTLKWSPVAGATGYTLHYGAGGATTETVGPGTTSKSFSGVATSGDFSVTVNVSYGSTTWSSVRSNVKHYTVLLFLVGVCADA